MYLEDEDLLRVRVAYIGKVRYVGHACSNAVPYKNAHLLNKIVF